MNIIFRRSSAKRVLTALLLLSLTLMLGFCTEEPAPKKTTPAERTFPGYHALLDEIVRSRSGLFRGLSLNNTMDEVRKAEHATPTEESKDHLFYEYVADSITNYSIDYGFENDSLSEINVQINCKDVDLSSYLFCDLKDYYANKLPNPKEDKGYVVYNCFEGQRMPFVVSLSDNSTTGMGIINMIIYKDK